MGNLKADLGIEPDFLVIFFTTYRTFLTMLELWTLLLERFNVDSTDDSGVSYVPAHSHLTLNS
jgi:hypothetical protein